MTELQLWSAAIVMLSGTLLTPNSEHSAAAGRSAALFFTAMPLNHIWFRAHPGDAAVQRSVLLIRFLIEIFGFGIGCAATF